ncbi:hypothetical protein FOL47_005705 [Perkinsus chesapeaki]|uniref:START domain-containing protein n=1 Tax=Perkinsus chesapeaki TaxID=330153 RepID=A0A7J6LX34_PERCH|nr:hypothetical protein FOL47_005705 [Perkinsus chesapeaki]
MSVSDLGFASWCSATFASDDDQLEFGSANSRETTAPVAPQKPLKTVVKHGQEKTDEHAGPSRKAPNLLLQTTIISFIVVLASSLTSALLGRYWDAMFEAEFGLNSFIEVEVFVSGAPVLRIGVVWAFPLALALAFYWKAKPGAATTAKPATVQQSPAVGETGKVDYELPEGASLIKRIREVLALPDAREPGADPDGFSTVHTQTEPYYCYVEKRSVMVGDGNEVDAQWMSQWRITVHIKNHSASEVYNVMGGRNESEWNSQCTGSELITAAEQRLEDRGLELVRCTYAGVPLTISAREVLQFRTRRREGDRSLLAFTSTGTEVFDIPVKDGYTRAHQHLGGWLIEPLPGDSTGTILKVISCVDPGG